MGGPDAAERLSRDTISNADSLAVPRKRHNAHDRQTSQAECRGFDSRLPLQRSPMRVYALDVARSCVSRMP